MENTARLRGQRRRAIRADPPIFEIPNKKTAGSGLRLPARAFGIVPVLSQVCLHRARQMPIGLDFVRAGLAGGRNILSPGMFQNLLRAPSPLRVIAVNGDQDATIFNPAFVAFGLVFWNSHSNQSSTDTANRAPDARSRQRLHNRTSGNEGPEPRHLEGSDAEQPAQGAA